MQSSIAIQLGGQCVGLSPKPRGSTSSSSMARWVLGPVYSLPSSVYHLQCPIFNLQSSAPSCGAGDCHLIAGPKQRREISSVNRWECIRFGNFSIEIDLYAYQWQCQMKWVNWSRDCPGIRIYLGYPKVCYKKHFV